MRPADGTRLGSHGAPRPAKKREERAEAEAQGAASLGGPKPGPREAPPRRGPAGGGGPGPSRAPSRLTQWPRHAGRACTCSKRLLADMASRILTGATAADSPQDGGGG